MKMTNWGNFPVIDANVFTPSTEDQVRDVVLSSSQLIARGLGRSYGDSSLNKTILSTQRLNHILGFDESSGIISCESGVSLAEILEAFVPRGWFLPVTPGTKFVTIGGAIAADVHGKNHHVAGSFSNHVLSMKILLSDGTKITCSKENNSDLFWMTCGGMGLTGIILEASFTLKKIETAYIRQQIIKAKNLDEAFNAFEANKSWTYSVAWIDCLAKGENIGRCALIVGEHASKNEIDPLIKKPLLLPKKLSATVPIYFPDFILNTYTVKLFNFFRYNTYINGNSIIDYDKFFYPLDVILQWNKIYGKRGFTQYQIVFPKENSKAGLKNILKLISESGEGSFLAVLKLFGKQDNNLSFPQEGYTLALDFPITREVLSLFKKLDEIVIEYGGRLYLAKDVRMNQEMFKKSYQNIDKFIASKKIFDRANKFQSLQSLRLGI